MSALLSADDLNDFISPGVACIKPVEVEKTSDKAEIEIGIDGVPVEVKQNGQSEALQPAQISLTDCLACSGCITSAEAVLVSMQSHTEVLNQLADPRGRIFVASVSHQVRVSLAGACNLTVEQADRRLKHLLVQELGFRYVVGTEIGRGISLEFGKQEVLSGEVSKPVLSSACPGWTCYVEKTHPQVIPHMSRVKSPQAITGTLIKDMLSRQFGVDKDQIYHVSLMPCFDKKLEAARPDLVGDVDCVVTTREIMQLLLDKGTSFDALPEAEFDDTAIAPAGWPVADQYLSHGGTSSGGYLEHALLAVRERAGGEEATRVEVVAGRNADVVEYRVIRVADGSLAGTVARVYGFRNIQNLVRKLKTPKAGGLRARRAGGASTTSSGPSTWDYVEVMACPGGCINGGGQVAHPDDVPSREWIERHEKIYNSIPQQPVYAKRVHKWISEMWHGSMASLTTAEFHAVETQEPTAISVGTKW